MAGDEHSGLFGIARGPAFEGKAIVFREVAVATDEVGQCALAGGAECLRCHGQGGLEQHRAHLVGVGTVDHLLGQGLGRGLTILGIGLADADQGIAPGLLGRNHLIFGDGLGCSARRRRVGGTGDGQHGSSDGRKGETFHGAGLLSVDGKVEKRIDQVDDLIEPWVFETGLNST